MGRQMFLFGEPGADAVSDDVALAEIRILAWNIQNPSVERAKSQVDWLIETKANVIILTEAKQSKGSHHIVSSLESLGFQVFFADLVEDEYTTLIATKGFVSEKWEVPLSFLPQRVETVILKTFLGDLKIVGIYSPSYGIQNIGSTKRVDFQQQITRWLTSLSTHGGADKLIIGGDLNIVEPDHVSGSMASDEDGFRFYRGFTTAGLLDAYRFLQPAAREYSWRSRDGDGQRLDHFFVSADLSPAIVECSYEHSPRHVKHSDHSAMWLKFYKR
jgi:exodeoxyribonuclease III